VSSNQRTGGIELDGAVAQVEAGPVRLQACPARGKPKPLIVAVEPEAEELGSGGLAAVVKPAEGKRVAGDGNGPTRGRCFTSRRKPGAPRPKVLAQSVGVAPQQHIATVELDPLHAE
jgi:hypothetical protein